MLIGYYEKPAALWVKMSAVYPIIKVPLKYIWRHACGKVAIQEDHLPVCPGGSICASPLPSEGRHVGKLTAYKGGWVRWPFLWPGKSGRSRTAPLLFAGKRFGGDREQSTLGLIYLGRVVAVCPSLLAFSFPGQAVKFQPFTGISQNLGCAQVRRPF